MLLGPGCKPYRERLRADPGFFLELSYCNDHGIPHSTFLGWEPSDRAKAIAFVLEKGTKCAMCGTAAWEWDPEQGGGKFAYEPIGVLCHGCYAKDSASEGTHSQAGVTIELHPTGTVESAKRLVAAQRRAEARAAKRAT